MVKEEKIVAVKEEELQQDYGEEDEEKDRETVS